MAFFDASGRIGGARFLLTSFIAIVVLSGCVASLVYLPAWTNPLSCAILGCALLSLISESARRLHDLGITAWVLAIVVPALSFVALAILFRYWVDTQAWLISAAAFSATAFLFFRAGDRAANRFGAAPPNMLMRGAAPGAPSRLRPILALSLAIVAGASVGFLLYTIDQGMRAQAEWRARMT